MEENPARRVQGRMTMNSKGGGFFSGFLWGMIIGVALVFLLGTKKGKRLLKVISEEGLELSELLGADGLEEFEEEVVQKPPKKKSVQKSLKTEEQSEVVEEPKHTGNGSVIKKITSPARRFFRGIPKRN